MEGGRQYAYFILKIFHEINLIVTLLAWKGWMWVYKIHVINIFKGIWNDSYFKAHLLSNIQTWLMIVFGNRLESIWGMVVFSLLDICLKNDFIFD